MHTKFLFLTLSLSLVFSLTSTTRAQGITQGSTIPSGVVVDNDAFLNGQDVVIDGTVNGNVVIVGNQVTINGTVNGSLILIGQNVAIMGEVSGSIYVLALTLEMGPAAILARDVYYAGVSLVTGSGATIQRDLYAIGLDAGLSGHVGRNLHTVIGPIQLFNGLMRLLGFEDMVIGLHFNPPPSPTPTPLPTPTSMPPLTPTSGGSSNNLYPVRVGFGDFSQASSTTSEQGWQKPLSFAISDTKDIGVLALRVLRDWGVLFLFGLLAVWLLADPLERIGGQLHSKPLQSIGYGLLIMVVSILLFGVALLLIALIFVLGLWIGSLGLWGISLAFWTAAYACLGFLLTALWAFIIYGTKVIVAYLVVSWLLSLVFPATVKYRVLSLFLGTLIYTLLRSIPMLGWVISVLVTAAGMGATWLAYRGRARLIAQSTTNKPKLRSASTKR